MLDEVKSVLSRRGSRVRVPSARQIQWLTHAGPTVLRYRTPVARCSASAGAPRWFSRSPVRSVRGIPLAWLFCMICCLPPVRNGSFEEVRQHSGSGNSEARAIGCGCNVGVLALPAWQPTGGAEADRKGQHSIRINDQWRVCFKWTEEGPEDVEIVDYH